MNNNIINKKLIWSIMSWDITYAKTSEYVMNLGIGKTLYQSNMDFNTKAHIRVDTLIYLHNTGFYPKGKG